MTASAATKTAIDNKIHPEIKPQIIKPAAKKGKNSDIGDLKREPKMIPIHAIITPVDIVIQKGPNEDLLYRCLISDQAKYKGSFIVLKPSRMSWKPIPYKRIMITFNIFYLAEIVAN